MKKPTVIVNVHGGVVQDIMGDPDIRVIVIDWDCKEDNDGNPAISDYDGNLDSMPEGCDCANALKDQGIDL